MQFRYGNYTHPNGEVNLRGYRVRPQFSPRKNRYFEVHMMDIEIQLQLTPAEDDASRDPNPITERINRQTLMNSKISNIIAVYEQNFQSCGLIHDDGSQTQHYLSNAHANNISGNYVMDRQWPRGEGDEYSTVRTGYVTIAAVFNFADSQIYSYDETFTVYGNGGADVRAIENATGPVTFQPVHQQTSRTIIQSGSIVGISDYLFGNVPPPIFPAYHRGPLEVARIRVPEWQGNAYKMYAFEWSYRMEIPSTATPPASFSLPTNFSTTTHNFPPGFI